MPEQHSNQAGILPPNSRGETRIVLWCYIAIVALGLLLAPPEMRDRRFYLGSIGIIAACSLALMLIRRFRYRK